jgi:hypothetical protein
VVDRAATQATERIAVVSSDSALKLGAAHRVTVEGWRKLADGYDVDVDAPDGGILMVNNTYFKFWRAEAEGAPLVIEPANGAHMAVRLPPGAQLVKIRYSRPTIRSLLFKG